MGGRMKEMTDKLTISVTGRVTMVGYRAFVAKKAQKLKLTGWVRNVKENFFFLHGEVDAYFEGDKATLEQILAECKRGPLGSGVRQVKVKWGRGKKVFGSFEVLR